MIVKKFLLSVVMAIMLCPGNVSAMEPEKEKNRSEAGNQEGNNAQKMMLLKEHMISLGEEQEDVRRKIGETLAQVRKKVFRCPTKEQMEAQRLASKKRATYFSINEMKYLALFPELGARGTYEQYTHAYVDINQKGDVANIICGDQTFGYYAVVVFKKSATRKGGADDTDFYAKDVTFDRTLAAPSPAGSRGLVLPLDTEFTIEKNKDSLF